MQARVSPIKCGARRIGKSSSEKRQHVETIEGTKARNEMDSMADTSCAGSNWKLIEYTGVTCDVHPFKEGYEAVRDVPIGTCATLVEGETGSDFILIGHEMLYFGPELQRSLLNQNQIRAHIHHEGGIVQDDYTRTDQEFGIHMREMFIPFAMEGAAVYFESRVPTNVEIETLPHIVLTSKDQWDPHTRPLRAACMQVQPARERERERGRGREPDDCVTGRDWWDVSPCFNEDEFRTRIISSVKIRDSYETELSLWCTPEIPRTRNTVISVSALFAQHRHSPVTAENLSRMWNVGLDTARRTLRATTQQGIRTAIHPITRRYRTDQLHLHRKRLNATFYTDTLFSKVQSLRGNKCAQVFTDGRFTAVYPLTTKQHAGDALRELTIDVGVPDTLVADQAGEQTGRHTEFARQVQQLHIQMHYTEPGRKNQNHTAEREIGILKTRWKRRMTDANIPTRLWDYGLVYEAEIMSLT